LDFGPLFPTISHISLYLNHKKVLDEKKISDSIWLHNMNKLFAILLLAAVGFAFTTTSAQATQTTTMTLAKVKKHHRHHGHKHHKKKHFKA